MSIAILTEKSFYVTPSFVELYHPHISKNVYKSFDLYVIPYSHGWFSYQYYLVKQCIYIYKQLLNFFLIIEVTQNDTNFYGDSASYSNLDHCSFSSAKSGMFHG